MFRIDQKYQIHFQQGWAIVLACEAYRDHKDSRGSHFLMNALIRF